MRYSLLLCCIAILAPAVIAEPIAITPVEGFNLKIREHIRDDYVVVRPDPPVHNWFAGKFVNLPVGQAVEISIDMNGCDTQGNVADTGKWAGLQPVYTYADPEKYESYEWFRRDARGRWVSGDPFKRNEARLAGDGKTPEQAAIPAALAERFLSADGNFWCPWSELPAGRNDTQARIFRLTIQPAAPAMTIAMHVPYLLCYEREMIARLKAARFPGVFVDELGVSGENHPLYLIRVDDPQDPAPLDIQPMQEPKFARVKQWDKDWMMTTATPTVRLAPEVIRPWGEKRLMFLDAREHPTEHVGSWVVLGALRVLLADTPAALRARRSTTWVLLPIYDPDGVAGAEYDRYTNGCVRNHNGSTAYANAYLSYLRAFPNAGWTFAVAATFYNLECNDGKPVCSPYAEFSDRENVIAFNRFWFRRLQVGGTQAGPEEPWTQGYQSFRLATGCSSRYRALSLTFEINDRFPENRLTLEEVIGIGGDFVSSATDWFSLPEGIAVLDTLRARQQERLRYIEREHFLEGYYGMTPDRPSSHELVTMGY